MLTSTSVLNVSGPDTVISIGSHAKSAGVDEHLVLNFS